METTIPRATALRYLSATRGWTPDNDTAVANMSEAGLSHFAGSHAKRRLAEAASGTPLEGSFERLSALDAIQLDCERGDVAAATGDWQAALREAGMGSLRDPGPSAPEQVTEDTALLDHYLREAGLTPLRAPMVEPLRPPTWSECLSEVGLEPPEQTTTVRHAGGARGFSEAATLLSRMAEAADMAPHTIVSKLAGQLPPDHPDRPRVMALLAKGATGLTADDREEIAELAQRHPGRLATADSDTDVLGAQGASLDAGRQRISSPSAVGSMGNTPPPAPDRRDTPGSLSNPLGEAEMLALHGLYVDGEAPVMGMREAMAEVERGGPPPASWGEAFAQCGLGDA